MPTYTPPTREVRFLLDEVLSLHTHSSLPAFAQLDDDLCTAIVDESARFAAEIIRPLNQVGHEQGCVRNADGSVTTPPGYREAYASYVEAGWGTLALPESFGGQGMPHVLATVVEEFLNSACHAFNMYPGLTHGAVAAIMARGSEELKATYLPKLVSGEWLGTMALTEPQCGTDLGLVRTRAEPSGDGTYAITGEKIFCSGGEQDLTDNIVHLVLARTPGAPEGSRGVSLFVVPKFIPGDDGKPGARNPVSCGSIEHKMGLNGSATCVMNFEGARGWLVGEENGGLAAMFVMMNAARLSCGNQGLAQAELAYQNAATYALDRRQGRAAGERKGTSAADPIIVHPDVRRMLMDARGFTEGFRALVLWTALQIDLSHAAEDADVRQGANALVAFLTPVLKGFGTDRGFEIAVTMQQVLGGHGYIREWGMEQIVRDARAAMLYEGANGVQALDLAGRKLARDGGKAADTFFTLVGRECEHAEGELSDIAAALADALTEARGAAAWLIDNADVDPDNLGAGSYAFMELIGTLAVGWMLLRLAKVALPKREDPYYAAKLVTARHYASQSLVECAVLRRKVESGARTMMALDAELFRPAM